jgi:hypothetical protein
MLRTQDILFGLLCLVLLGLLAFHAGVIVVALVGAFARGSVYVFAGMMPSPTESLGQRIFVSVFLSVVISSLILILPGTFGPGMIGPHAEKVVVAIAALPLAAVGFEVLRTPRVIRGFWRFFGYD